MSKDKIEVNMNVYDIPIVVEALEEANEEIERLNKEREIDIKYNKYLQKELAKANSIIKEVREYIEKSKSKLPLGINDFTCEMVYSDEVVLANELLEILDKGDK